MLCKCMEDYSLTFISMKLKLLIQHFSAILPYQKKITELKELSQAQYICVKKVLSLIRLLFVASALTPDLVSHRETMFSFLIFFITNMETLASLISVFDPGSRVDAKRLPISSVALKLFFYIKAFFYFLLNFLTLRFLKLLPIYLLFH